MRWDERSLSTCCQRRSEATMVGGVSGDPAGYALAYEEGKAAVEEQSSTLRETRDRIGTVVSAAAVVAGLVTALAAQGKSRDIGPVGLAGGVVAGLGFVVLIASAVWVWTPF